MKKHVFRGQSWEFEQSLAEWVRVREVGQSYKLLKNIKLIRVGFINKISPRHIEQGLVLWAELKWDRVGANTNSVH